MSARFSPDGLYYWDGAQWVSTLSPDRRYRWNGSAWVPVAIAPPPTMREPTSWTRPLQSAVIAWYVVSAILSLSLPFWLSGQLTAILRASFQRSQALNPSVQPPPPGFFDAMNTFVTAMLWVAAVLGFAIALLFIAGAVMRWTWTYYVILVFLGLSVISGPANLVNLGAGGSLSSSGYTPAGWFIAYGLAVWLVSTALFVVMLIGLIRLGPWGLRKVIPAAAAPAA